jgi:hypothetical protein
MMLFIKNFVLYIFDFDTANETLLIHNHMNKKFVIVYGWHALSDDNLLYSVVSCNDHMFLELVYNERIHNAKQKCDHLFFSHGVSTELCVIDNRNKITKLYDLDFDDILAIKHLIVRRCINNVTQMRISMTTYIIGNKLVIQIIQPQLTPKIMCADNIVDFAYSDSTLYAINKDNAVLEIKIANIISDDTLTLNFNQWCNIEPDCDCKLFAIYQDKHIQTNFISQYDYPTLQICTDDDRYGSVVITYDCINTNVYGYKLDSDEITPFVTFYAIANCRDSYYDGDNLAIENNNGTIDIYERNKQNIFVKKQTINGVLGYNKTITKSANNNIVK